MGCAVDDPHVLLGTVALGELLTLPDSQGHLFGGALRLAGAVAPARGGASAVASRLGRRGTDPARGSAPLAALVKDVPSRLIYFAGESWIVLRGRRGPGAAARPRAASASCANHR